MSLSVTLLLFLSTHDLQYISEDLPNTWAAASHTPAETRWNALRYRRSLCACKVSVLLCILSNVFRAFPSSFAVLLLISNSPDSRVLPLSPYLISLKDYENCTGVSLRLCCTAPKSGWFAVAHNFPLSAVQLCHQFAQLQQLIRGFAT